MSSSRCKDCDSPIPPPKSSEWRARPRLCDECRETKRVANGVRQREKRRQNPEVAERDREYWRKRYLANREAIIVAQWKNPTRRAYMREYLHNYYLAHKAKHQAAVRARAKKYKRSSNGRQCDWRDIGFFWVLQSGLCFWCDAPLRQDDFHVDHLIPLSKGGKHERANFVLSCPTCNLRKHALLPLAFAARLRQNA